MPPVEAECVGSPTDAGGGAAEGIQDASTQSGDIASVEAERDRELCRLNQTRESALPRKRQVIARQRNVAKGHVRHFAPQKSSEPFRRRTTVKSVTDLPIVCRTC